MGIMRRWGLQTEIDPQYYVKDEDKLSFILLALSKIGLTDDEINDRYTEKFFSDKKQGKYSDFFHYLYRKMIWSKNAVYVDDVDIDYFDINLRNTLKEDIDSYAYEKWFERQFISRYAWGFDMKDPYANARMFKSLIERIIEIRCKSWKDYFKETFIDLATRDIEHYSPLKILNRFEEIAYSLDFYIILLPFENEFILLDLCPIDPHI